MNTAPVGLHFFVEIQSEKELPLFNDSIQLEEILHSISAESDMKVIKGMVHNFEPVGVTGILLLEESHISIHTWPENNYAAMDLFTCSMAVDREKLQSSIQKFFPSCKVQFNVVERGFKA